MTNGQIKKYHRILKVIAIKQWGGAVEQFRYIDSLQSVPVHKVDDPEFLAIFARLRQFRMTKADRKIVQKLQFKYLT